MPRQQKQITPDQMQEALETSVQTIDREGGPSPAVGIGLLYWLAAAGEIVPPWWSKARDAELRTFWKRSDVISGAVYTLQSKIGSVPFRVVPKDRSVKRHVEQAKELTNRLAGLSLAHSGAIGWQAFIEPFILDLLTQDNGAFAEVIGPGKPDGPIDGMPYALRHMDSWRCHRTGDDEYPVIYQRRDGPNFKLHHTRVIMKAQMESPAEEMFGIGFCALSRCINTAQLFIDMATYKQEKLGSRPPRQFLVGKGFQFEEIADAIRLANESFDNQQLSKFANTVVLGSDRTDVDLTRIDMAGLPDHFDYMTEMQLGISLVALAFGVDVRDLAFAIGVAGQTKADAQIQHLKARGKAVGQILEMLQWLIGSKFLPAHLELIFDWQDDEQDAAQADIRDKRAGTRKTDLETQVIGLRQARERMLEDGDLTEAQFEDLELAEGRLPDGTPVVTLFYDKRDQRLAELLDVGVEDPLDTDAHDAEEILPVVRQRRREAEAEWASGSTGNIRKTAHRAVAALNALEELYGGGEQEEQAPPQAGGEEEAPAHDQEPDEDQPPDEEQPAPEEGEPPDEVKELLWVRPNGDGRLYHEKRCGSCGERIPDGEGIVIKDLFGWELVCSRHNFDGVEAYTVEGQGYA